MRMRTWILLLTCLAWAVLPAARVAAEVATGVVDEAATEVVERPQDVEALPAEWLDKIDRLTAEAVRWRGLDAGEEIPAGVQGEAALEKRLGQMIYEQLPDDVAVSADRVLKAFDLVSEDLDLRAFYQDLMTEQVAGYFDPSTEYLVMVEREDEPDDNGDGELMSMVEDAILVHEIGHYLQHRHFDLGPMLESEDVLSDAVVARAALTEGDATLVMYSHMMGVALERLPTLDSMFEAMAENPALLMEMSPDLPQGEDMADAPAYIRDGLIFPYFQGFVFSSRIRQAGGQKLLDHAFRSDRPKSTEQILHPEKWISERDEPVIIELPEFAELLPGYQMQMAGTWGELNTRIILTEAGSSFKEARSAAYGWGGDRFALLTKGRREVVVWVTEWDSAMEAREFSTVARKVLKGWHHWYDTSQTRVVLVNGRLRPKRLEKLGAALWAAAAERLPTQNIDLAALEIGDEDLPQPLEPEEIEEMMNHSGLQAWFDESDLERAEQEARIDQDLLGALDGMTADDIEGMQNSEIVQNLLKTIDKPVGEVNSDGQFGIAELGFSMDMPEAASWQPADSAVIEALVTEPQVMWTHEALNAHLMIIAIQPPMPVTLPTIVAGVKLMQPLANFEIRESEEIDSQPPGHFLWYSGGEEGSRVEVLNRYYVVDGYMVTVQATVYGENPSLFTEIQRLFSSISFIEPAADAAE